MRRTVFATPRAAEFCELRALQAQTGQPADAFGHVVVKELLDNALDAAETAGKAPVVLVDTRTVGPVTLVTVCDNGAGIAPATVADVCDFNVLASDKARYRGPSRGAQGNALKTILGIPAALGVDEPVVIDSAGVRHELRVRVDAAGDLLMQHDNRPGRTVGTAVTVALPADLDVDAARWALGTALVNPHATITAADRAYDDVEDEAVFYKPAGQGWSKWTPGQPSSPHWYDGAAFAGLVGAYVRHIGRSGVDVPLGRFITEFDGLSGSAKQKAIRQVVPGITHVSQLAGRDDLVAALHTAMRAAAKPTPPAKLGPAGADHFRALLHDEYGVARFWYKSAAVTSAGVPWIIEAAVADTVQPGRVWYAVNHGAAFADPLGRTRLDADGVSASGAGPLFADMHLGYGNRAAVVHVVCAATQFVDKGKVALVVGPDVAAAAAGALAGATKTLRREAAQRRRDAAKADRAARRRADGADRAERENCWTIKEAVFEVLPQAKAAAGDVVAARTLFYKVRPLIQPFTDAELGYDYFSQTLLPEYERIVAVLPGLYYEARGALHHPHDGAVIPLGTREVQAYTPPTWQFDKVLYIEKEGLEAQLAPYELDRRYDMAVIFGKGFSVTACRNLLARAEIREMQIFVLHDADIGGYNIARTLAQATRRMPDHSIDVSDLGLSVPQAIELGLETERFTRRKAPPADLELDCDARRWFTGTPIPVGYGKFEYECLRCELNAFSADGLAEFIEVGLARHGATTKVVPPADVLAAHVAVAREKALRELVAAELADIVDIGAVARRLLDDNPDLVAVEEDHVRGRLDDHPTESWRAAVHQLVRGDVDTTDGLLDDVRALLAQLLRGEDGDR